MGRMSRQVVPAAAGAVFALEDNVGGAVATQASYRGHIRAFNEWNDGEAVSDRRIAEYLAQLQGRLAPATIAVKKAALKKAIKATFRGAARDMKWLAGLDLAFAEIKVPRAKFGLSERDVLRPEEVEQLASAAPARVSLFVRALFASGLRISELLNVRRRDCYRAVRPEARGGRGSGERWIPVRVLGKGSKERELLAFPEQLHAEIMLQFGCRHTEQFIFRSTHPRNRSGKFSRQYVGRVLNEWSENILGRPLHPHALRHSHATALLEAGVSIDAVAARLGHADKGTTARFYAHTRVFGDHLASVTL
jgi:integrase/recombinase XerD